MTTSNPTTPLYQTPRGCGAPVFKNADGYAEPAGRRDLREAARHAADQLEHEERDVHRRSRRTCRTRAASTPGPTTITFLADGKMNVVSPYTKVTETNVDGRPSGRRAPPSTASAATDPALQQHGGRDHPGARPEPDLRAGRADSSTDTNYWAAGHAVRSHLPDARRARPSRRLRPATRSVATYSGGFKFGTHAVPGWPTSCFPGRRRPPTRRTPAATATCTSSGTTRGSHDARIATTTST